MLKYLRCKPSNRASMIDPYRFIEPIFICCATVTQVSTHKVWV